MSQKLINVLTGGDSLLSQIRNRYAEEWRLIQIISGFSDGQQELLYFFTDERDVRILRVKAPKRSELVSAGDFYPSAGAFERELKEKCRIRFQGSAVNSSVMQEDAEEENETRVNPVLDLGRLVKDRDAVDCIPALERVNGTDSFGYGMAYCALLEGLAGIRVSPRTDALRLVFQETVRAACHLLWFAELLEPLGMRLFAIRCYQLREGLLSFPDRIAGSRLIPSLCGVGGMKKDPKQEELAELSELLKIVEREWKQIEEALYRDRAFLHSLTGRCVYSADEVRRLGLTGPVARACGLAWDCRGQEDGYTQLNFQPVVREGGDLLAQSAVRSGEILQSVELARGQLQNMPSGTVLPTERMTFSGERVLRLEQPEGEAVLYARAEGSERLEALTVRRPEAMVQLAGASLKEGSVALWLR